MPPLTRPTPIHVSPAAIWANEKRSIIPIAAGMENTSNAARRDRRIKANR